MLRITQIEEITAFLLKVPDLVRQQEARSFAFAASVEGWLANAESVLNANRLYQAGQLASLRSGLVAARHGTIPSGIEFRGLPSRLRVINAVASQALRAGSDIVGGVVAEARPRILEAERVAQQVIAFGLSRGIIPVRIAIGNTTEYLCEVRQALTGNADLDAAMVHLEGLVGPSDTLVLLDRSLTPYIHDPPAPATNSGILVTPT